MKVSELKSIPIFLGRKHNDSNSINDYRICIDLIFRTKTYLDKY